MLDEHTRSNAGCSGNRKKSPDRPHGRNNTRAEQEKKWSDPIKKEDERTQVGEHKEVRGWKVAKHDKSARNSDSLQTNLERAGLKIQDLGATALRD